jgi:UDP-4-amino-4,6-dideoxy-N-acetyl-beta-L-altrosamine transaminase
VRVTAPSRAKLALEGGSPVREKLLPYGRQQITEEDIEAVNRVLRSDWLTTGPKVEEFERAVAEFVGADHAVCFSSGTAALHAAVFAAGLKAGDEVITSPLTFCATANAVLYQGARPVFADVCDDTLDLDPHAAAASITPQTRALLPVDYAGYPADLDAFLDLAARHKLIVIEDACHALGATYKARKVGAIAHMTVFSFHPVKHVATGEGGMVTTENAEFAQRLRMFRNHGISSEARGRHERGQWRYEMVELGYNYRLSDMACALGISQLRRLPVNLARRRAIAAHYQRSFSQIDEIIPPAPSEGVESAWHLYPIRLRLESLRACRDDIFRALRAENIGVNVHYIPVYQHPYYRRQFPDVAPCPVTERVFESLITLPMFHAMSDSDVQDVIQAVDKVISHYRK